MNNTTHNQATPKDRCACGMCVWADAKSSSWAHQCVQMASHHSSRFACHGVTRPMPDVLQGTNNCVLAYMPKYTVFDYIIMHRCDIRGIRHGV